MAATQCNISFAIDYTSSQPIIGAKASYKIQGSADAPYIHNITPIPASGNVISLPNISVPGEYELTVELTGADGKTVTEKSKFKIGNCSPSATLFWENANTNVSGNYKTAVRIRISINGNIVVNTLDKNVNYISTDGIETWKKLSVNPGDRILFEAIVEVTSGNSIGNIWAHTTTGTTGITAATPPTAPNTILLFHDFMSPNFTEGHVFQHSFTIEQGKNYAILTDWFQ